MQNIPRDEVVNVEVVCWRGKAFGKGSDAPQLSPGRAENCMQDLAPKVNGAYHSRSYAASILKLPSLSIVRQPQ